MANRQRSMTMWGPVPSDMPPPTCEVGKHLAAFTPEDMRAEIALVHDLCLPAPFVMYVSGIYSARIADEDVKKFWTLWGDERLPKDAFLNIVRNGSPGYSWYVDVVPDSNSYAERGGGCLFAETVDNACDALGISRDRLTAPVLAADEAREAEQRFADELMAVRHRVWLLYGVEERRLDVCATLFPKKDAVPYKALVLDLLPTLRSLLALAATGDSMMALRARRALQRRVGGAVGLTKWLLANGELTEDEAAQIRAFDDEWSVTDADL